MSNRYPTVNLAFGLCLALIPVACGDCNVPANSLEDAGVWAGGGPGGSSSSGQVGGRDAGMEGNSSSGDGGQVPDAGNGCTNQEICGDGLDNDCAHGLEDGCPCRLGATQPCYDGPPSQAGRGVCTWGTQTCTMDGEEVVWGTCEGAGHPQEVQCGGQQDWHCNGNIDEGCPCHLNETRPCYSGPAGTDGRGVCRAGQQTCVAPGTDHEWSGCFGEVTPGTDQCDGTDRDCDGNPNTGCACEVGATQPCYTGPAGTNGVGLCHAGTQLCEDTGTGASWSECRGQVVPRTELCDGQDHDCDGNPNTGCSCTVGVTQPCYTGPQNTSNRGMCHGGMQTCELKPNGSGWSGCVGEVTPSTELCDGRDHDCDGTPNTGCACQVGQVRSCYTGPQGTLGMGLCHSGSQRCVQQDNAPTWGPCEGEVTPGTETCDGQDHLCNGQPGVGCTCRPTQTRPCYTGPAGTRGVGSCKDGTQYCSVINGSLNWETECHGQTLPATSDSCGNHVDDNCNGPVDENCGGSITCPGDRTMEAGDTIALSVTGQGLHGYAWSITDAPVGGASSAIWTPSPPTGASVRFRPIIVGQYTIRVSGQDLQGQSHACTFKVNAQSHGLRIELTWDGTGDVDLHLHNANSTPWFGNSDDCYYRHKTPTWGAWLDVDNVNANGPENIRIDNPALNHDYTVAIHNYARAAGRRATVKVYCGTTEGNVPTATYVSQQLNGDASGQCTGNTFWRIARIRFTSPTDCSLTFLNSYSTGSNACSNL